MSLMPLLWCRSALCMGYHTDHGTCGLDPPAMLSGGLCTSVQCTCLSAPREYICAYTVFSLNPKHQPCEREKTLNPKNSEHIPKTRARATDERVFWML